MPVARTYFNGGGNLKNWITSYAVLGSREELEAICEQEHFDGVFIDTRAEYRISGFRHDINISIDILDYDGPLRRLVEENIRDIVAHCTKSKKIYFWGFNDPETLMFLMENGEGELNVEATIVESLAPTRKVNLCEPAGFQVGLLGKGQKYLICRLVAGIDVATGCVTNASRDGFYHPEWCCPDCYSGESAKPCADTIYKFTKESLREKFLGQLEEMTVPANGPLIIRLGQRSEANIPREFRELYGAPYGLKTALEFLVELAEERDIRVVLPTKFPDFDGEMIELMKAANVVLQISTLNKEHERGAEEWGYGLQRRLELGLKIAEQGIPTHLFVATNLTEGFPGLHADAQIAYEFWQEHQDILHLMWLDYRIEKKWLADEITGRSWDELKQKRKFSEDDGRIEVPGGRWRLTANNRLAAMAVHPDFREAVGNNRGNQRFCVTKAIPGVSLERGDDGIVRMFYDSESKASDNRCGLCFTDKI